MKCPECAAGLEPITTRDIVRPDSLDTWWCANCGLLRVVDESGLASIRRPLIARELLPLVNRLRSNQKEYFRTKRVEAMNASMRLEKQVDTLLATYSPPAGDMLF